MDRQNYKNEKQVSEDPLIPALFRRKFELGFKTSLPPLLLRALENLPPPLRERAVTRYRRDVLERPPEELARERLTAQARLLEAAARERKNDPRLKSLSDEAFRLLNAGAPLGGYAKLLQARSLAMRLGTEAPEPESYAEAVLARQGRLEALSGHARELALALVSLALEVGVARGYHARTSEVAYHLPQQVLAGALWPDAKPETARKRVQRGLKALAGLGLLSYRGRVGNARDRETGKLLGWKDGTVILIRLLPGKARALTHEDLAHPWRDLEADIKKGRTARHRFSGDVSQSKNIKRGKLLLEVLKDWALAPVVKAKVPLSDWDTGGAPLRVRVRNALMDVRLAERPLRRDLVESAARLLAHALADPHSLEFYAALLWGALRRYDQGEDLFNALATEFERVLVDREEGFARRAGALLVSRLRASGLYASLMGVPPYRVA